MFCINCGVKLADGETKCPLCNTPVVSPNLNSDIKPLYPKNKIPKTKGGSKVLCGAILILFFIPILVSFISDFQWDKNLTWFGYVALAIMVAYVVFALPLWFKKPNPVIFVPCDFAAITIYLLYINLATNGGWFLSFALPLTCGLALITCAVVTLLYYLKKGRLYIFGGAFMALGLLTLLLEFLLKLSFGIKFIGWSFYPLLVLFLFGGLLIYLGINKTARKLLERKLFF